VRCSVAEPLRLVSDRIARRQLQRDVRRRHSMELVGEGNCHAKLQPGGSPEAGPQRRQMECTVIIGNAGPGGV
jgi:hypothetical protein